MTNKRRMYDVVIPNDLRPTIYARRLHPDGRAFKSTFVRRGDTTIQKYPWDKLKPGDFFTASLNGSRWDAAINKMYQTARTRNIEIAIAHWTMPNGEPGLRVTYVLDGVHELKMKTKVYHGKFVPTHDRAALLKRRSTYKKACNLKIRAETKPIVRLVDDPPPPRAPAKKFDKDAIVEISDDEITKRRKELLRARGKL